MCFTFCWIIGMEYCCWLHCYSCYMLLREHLKWRYIRRYGHGTQHHYVFIVCTFSIWSWSLLLLTQTGRSHGWAQGGIGHFGNVGFWCSLHAGHEDPCRLLYWYFPLLCRVVWQNPGTGRTRSWLLSLLPAQVMELMVAANFSMLLSCLATCDYMCGSWLHWKIIHFMLGRG